MGHRVFYSVLLSISVSFNSLRSYFLIGITSRKSNVTAFTEHCKSSTFHVLFDSTQVPILVVNDLETSDLHKNHDL